MVKKKTKRIEFSKSPPWQKIPVSKELLEAFRKCKEDKWQSDNLFNKYSKLAKEHLGKYAEDGLERDRLAVCLTKMILGSMNRDFSHVNGV